MPPIMEAANVVQIWRELLMKNGRFARYFPTILTRSTYVKVKAKDRDMPTTGTEHDRTKQNKRKSLVD